MLALEEEENLSNHRVVLRAADVGHTRRVAAMNVVLRAWTWQQLQLPLGWRVRLAPAWRRPRRGVVAARAVGKDLVHQIQRRVHGTRAGVGTEVAVAVASEAAHAVD